MAKGGIAKARKAYGKWASGKKVRATTLKMERVAKTAAGIAAQISGRPEVAHKAGLAIGAIKAVGGHNQKTRAAGRAEAAHSAGALVGAYLKAKMGGPAARTPAPPRAMSG